MTLELASGKYPLLGTEVSLGRETSIEFLLLYKFLMNLIPGTSCNTIKIYQLKLSLYAITEKLHWYWANKK
ncbi:hypothetical protein NIES4072_10320 [Nostoc commune NIES-4072]|uniref:Uncharacterized protein n=1 Tax=Nostoc commune NIES-4072 TaxID=2005467 RepID=A0A2R5FFQ3_NOSCO|nr:hypothetical protein NIES4070_16510 [Nostoc commune HK-02]GBG17376.1 hypothetical protein NIES4072_10320 [Nostoc commune NIES-4072]